MCPGSVRHRGTPSYRRLSREEVAERVSCARELLSACTLCPRRCGADRLSGGRGFCRAGSEAEVASWCPHFGEERPLSGRCGSGTVFFSRCTLSCAFCQNADISQNGGIPVTSEQLGEIFLALERRGCHNINLVSPTHFTPQILEALMYAAGCGLSLPLVWNTSGYETAETLGLLDGIVDIYLPDAKFWDGDTSRVLTGAGDYPDAMRLALPVMQAQVRDLVCRDGIAEHGLLIRHLVLPGGLAGTCPVMEFISGSVSKNACVNLMDQYRPCHRVLEGDHPLFRVLRRGVTRDEMDEAAVCVRSAGLTRGFGFHR